MSARGLRYKRSMILSDRDLKARLERGDLVIEPIADLRLQLQPASVDLRLGSEFRVFKPAQVAFLNPGDPKQIEAATEQVVVPEGDPFVLHPGAFALGTTVERVRIPPDLVGQVDGRSSIGRLAIVVHATAGFIDPGFEGQITLELGNIGSVPVQLYPGMRVAQLVVSQMTSAAERPYGPERGSHYQGQVGPVASRIDRE